MYSSRILLQLFIYGIYGIYGINSQSVSKCPDFFEYDISRSETTDSKWFGELILNSEFTLNGYWVEIELSYNAEVFGLKSDIPLLTKDNRNYILVASKDKLEPGKPVKIPVFVKYNELDDIPEITSIRINGREVCPTQSPAPVGISPCPGIFSYDADQQELFEKWLGAVSLDLEYDLKGLFVEVHLTSKADLVGAYNYRVKYPNNQEIYYWNSVGDITSKDNTIFSFTNNSFILKHGHLLTIPFFVKYNIIEDVPLVKSVVVNGRVICEGSNKDYISQIPLVFNADNIESLAFGRSQTTQKSVNKFFPTMTTTTRPILIPEVEDEDYTWTNRDDGYQCGLAEVTDKIIGADATTIRKHPWHGAIFREGSYKCGMSLISRKHAISAAHCFFLQMGRYSENDLEFRFGIDSIKNQLFSESQTGILSKIQLHENYMYHSAKYDLALITFKNQLRITETVTPVCLWSGDDSQQQIINKVATIVGFGTTENNKLSEHLREAKILVVDSETCREKDQYFYAKELSVHLSFCAGNISEIASCGGDSGGGVFFKKPGSEIWEIRGVTSSSRPKGSGCDIDIYVIYTDVAKFKTWILSKMEPTLR